MTVRSLDDWLAHAERVHPVGIDMGLARVRRVAERLDVLPPAQRNIVVAGTNGKGSTSIYLEALLLADGRSVGTTLSPHLSRFNERVRVNGEAVDDATLCHAFATIEEARGETTLTYFEFGVLAALLVFRRAGVDTTVLEVGLGGRLDAVNIVDGCVSVITSIGIDHVGYLGPDRESIGREKAGILRRGVPCVYGEASIPSTIVDAARTLDVPLTRFGTEYSATLSECTWSFEGRSASQPVHATGLVTPSVALNNAATALQALLLLGVSTPIERLVAGACSARLPGRFERFDYRGASVIVDVAHNPHGAAFLVGAAAGDAACRSNDRRCRILARQRRSGHRNRAFDGGGRMDARCNAGRARTTGGAFDGKGRADRTSSGIGGRSGRSSRRLGTTDDGT